MRRWRSAAPAGATARWSSERSWLAGWGTCPTSQSDIVTFSAAGLARLEGRGRTRMPVKRRNTKRNTNMPRRKEPVVGVVVVTHDQAAVALVAAAFAIVGELPGI